MPIKVLDPKTVARIAAGEVVERPASVVKELVENALDAGATQITVEVRGGGVSLLRVTDNGVGIPAAEVELAFERHATSKITSADDLSSVQTLGFRGEALASIAAVAQVDMVTATAGEGAGAYLALENGVVTHRGSQGRSPGTTVTVTNLFRKLPARLKFLKSPATENSHIANVVSQYALAFPEVKFTLMVEGRVTLRTPGSGRLLDSVAQVYGLEVARNILEIESAQWRDSRSDSTQVTGMVSAPSVARSSRSYLSFFINRRWVNSRLLAWAVEEAYHGLLMEGRHPVAVINVALPPAEVDVNIHPTKTEIKFHNERAVFLAVQRAVRQALVQQMPVPQIEEVDTTYRAPSAGEVGTPVSASLFPPAPVANQTPASALPVLRVLGQFRSSFIVAEGPDGLYLIDQHAAHERICFDQLSRQRAQQTVEVQGLLEPVTIEVSPQQATALPARLSALAEFGFALEAFGTNTYLVRSVPLMLGADWHAALREILDSPHNSHWSEGIAQSIACHSAVRAGQVLSHEEMRELVRQLEQTTTPQTCPHGRPTMLHLTSERLRKEFGRE